MLNKVWNKYEMICFFVFFLVVFDEFVKSMDNFCVEFVIKVEYMVREFEKIR